MLKTNGKKVWEACGVDAVYLTCDYMMRYATGVAAENFSSKEKRWNV